MIIDILIRFEQTLHHLTDVIYFGALYPCEKCGKGSMVFSNSHYICTRETAWGRCDNVVREPSRMGMTMSFELLMNPFLKPKETVKTRALHAFR